MADAPKVYYRFVELPLTRLHVMICGQGEPLIIVPATISELNNWKTLVQFMGQHFRVYFFELPGHGQSTPFKAPFQSELVAETVEQLTDYLGIKKFYLMGFSFGGILALTTFHRLKDRVKKIILLAPCVGHDAVKYSSGRLLFIEVLEKMIRKKYFEKTFISMLHNQKTVELIVRLLAKLGKIENITKLKEKLLVLPESTLKVLENQINEILTLDMQNPKDKYNTPCFFAMSVNDPLLDFNFTLNFLENHFSYLTVKRFYFPYHQPPRPYTLPELKKNYNSFLDLISKT